MKRFDSMELFTITAKAEAILEQVKFAQDDADEAEYDRLKDIETDMVEMIRGLKMTANALQGLEDYGNDIINKLGLA